MLDNIDTAEMNTEIKSEMLRVVGGEIAKALHGEEGVACAGETVTIS